MQRTSLTEGDRGQMLLATGVVLLMSLLSMAIFGVKVAGLTLPHDAASDVGADERESTFNCGQAIMAARLLIKLVSLREI